MGPAPTLVVSVSHTRDTISYYLDFPAIWQHPRLGTRRRPPRVIRPISDGPIAANVVTGHRPAAPSPSGVAKGPPGDPNLAGISPISRPQQPARQPLRSQPHTNTGRNRAARAAGSPAVACGRNPSSGELAAMAARSDQRESRELRVRGTSHMH